MIPQGQVPYINIYFHFKIILFELGDEWGMSREQSYIVHTVFRRGKVVFISEETGKIEKKREKERHLELKEMGDGRRQYKIPKISKNFRFSFRRRD